MPIEKVCWKSRNLREGQGRPVEMNKVEKHGHWFKKKKKKAFFILEHYLSVLNFMKKWPTLARLFNFSALLHQGGSEEAFIDLKMH